MGDWRRYGVGEARYFLAGIPKRAFSTSKYWFADYGFRERRELALGVVGWGETVECSGRGV